MLNQKKLYTKILDSLNQSGTSYCKLPDGTLIQWGHTAVGGLTQQVTMTEEFVDTSYKVLVTLVANSNTATNVTAITNSTKGKFSLGVNIAPSGGANWLAIGKWK